MDSTVNQINNRQIAMWLIVCAVVIFSMIILGGATRLTHSGLSMVEWKPLVGIVPPLNQAEWEATFEKYKAYPEYQKVNLNMDLAGFKKIFWFEYAHRVLGRLIGVIFLLPFLYFYFRKRIEKSLTPKLIIMFVLGSLQGVLGWYMVKSGLINEPRVSQYRLTAHLGAAVVIYAYILWVAFELLFSNKKVDDVTNKRLYYYSLGLSCLIFLMILSGGLVAGTRAGLAYNTFPFMGDSFFPGGMFILEPIWLNLFENIVTIQFNHRIFAYLIFILVIIFYGISLRSISNARVRLATHFFLFTLFLQVTLGITTLLYHVPVVLATAHQGGAILLLTASLFLTKELKPKLRIQ